MIIHTPFSQNWKKIFMAIYSLSENGRRMLGTPPWETMLSVAF